MSPRLRTGADTAPLVGALGIGEGAVQDGYALAETVEELPRHGRRQRDFRYHQQGAASLRKHRVDGIEVDLGLPRAGDAVEQEGVKAPFFDDCADLREGGRLR